MSIGSLVSHAGLIGGTEVSIAGGPGNVGADPMFTMSFTTSLGDGLATLEGVDLMDGSFGITSGSLVISGSPITADNGIYGLDGAYTSPYPSFNTSPLGAFWYNNLLYNPSSPSAPAVDLYGLLFSNGTGEINIFFQNGQYQFYHFTPGVGYDIAQPFDTLTTAVPEPSTIALAILGTLGIMARRWQRKLINL
jgi:hypothetical protein